MTRRTSDRAVSDVLGYVFVFSIIVALIGVLYVSGVGSLTGIRQTEQMNNADRGFVALGENFADLQSGRAPRRAGEIRLANGELSIGDASHVTLTVDSKNSVVGPIQVGQGALVYTLAGETVRYENGAVFRSQGGVYQLDRNPEFLCTADHAIISTVTLKPEGNISSIQRPGTVLISGARKSVELLYPSTGTSQIGVKTITLTISSDAADGWKPYLTNSGWKQTSSDTYTCTSKRAYVRETVIGIRILS